jgi:hypothetical protein
MMSRTINARFVALYRLTRSERVTPGYGAQPFPRPFPDGRVRNSTRPKEPYRKRNVQ